MNGVSPEAKTQRFAEVITDQRSEEEDERERERQGERGGRRRVAGFDWSRWI